MTAHRCGGCSRCRRCSSAHPQRDRLLDCGFRDAVHQPGHRPSVVRGLQQPGNELHVVAADDARRLLKAEEGLEPRGQHVTVGVPPARRVGLPGQGEQVLPFGLVADPVEAEQVRHVALLEAGAAQFEAADLGPRRPDRVPGAFPGDPRTPGGAGAAAHREASGPPSGRPGCSQRRRIPPVLACSASCPMPSLSVRILYVPSMLARPGPLRLAEWGVLSRSCRYVGHVLPGRPDLRRRTQGARP